MHSKSHVVPTERLQRGSGMWFRDSCLHSGPSVPRGGERLHPLRGRGERNGRHRITRNSSRMGTRRIYEGDAASLKKRWEFRQQWSFLNGFGLDFLSLHQLELKGCGCNIHYRTTDREGRKHSNITNSPALTSIIPWMKTCCASCSFCPNSLSISFCGAGKPRK